MGIPIDQTYYELLEVAPSASEHEIHKAYLRAKQTYSPDSPALYTMFTEDEARDLMKLIEEAYAVLGSVARREEYDREIKVPPRVVKKESTVVDMADHGAAVIKKTEPMTSTPAGHGRTRLGLYKMDAKMEDEINARTDFDGHYLQKIRTYKSISMESLSNESRISKAYLIAVEANDYASLPAPVFVRGFVAQVARILGLPEQKVANSYMAIYKNTRGN